MIYRIALVALLALFTVYLNSAQAMTPVYTDLLQKQAVESETKSKAQIRNLNEQTLTDIEATNVDRIVNTAKGQRLNALPLRWAQKVVQSINRHPVVSEYQYEKYNQPGHEIGFCFGRATYTHLALLKMGVNKDAIRKAWIVGPMDGDVSWSFHVTTIVKADNGEWLALDSVPGKILTVRDWYKYFLPMNKKHKNLRIYITEPQKFTASLADYDAIQMGLNLSQEEDWYKHYFVDLRTWFASENDVLNSVGLKDLRIR